MTIPKIGDKIKIISMKNEPTYKDKIGIITNIDSLNQLHGTWGGLAIIPEIDKYEIIEDSNND